MNTSNLNIPKTFGHWLTTVFGSLIALLELGGVEELDCARVVVCLDRTIEETSQKSLMRDLGWVGFELHRPTLSSEMKNVISGRWIFMAVDV